MLENEHCKSGLAANFYGTAGHKMTVRERFARAAKQVFVQPVILEMTPPKEVLDLLRELEAKGYANPVAFGGALRDAYLIENGVAQPRDAGDIDIALRAAGADEYFDAHEFNPSAWFMLNASFASHTAEALIENIVGITATSLEKADTYKDFDACIEADYKADGQAVRKLDLCFSDKVYTTEDLSLSGDAPINCIAMDSKGNVYAHPDFKQHAERLLYKNIDPSNNGQRAEERFNSLAQKIPGLVSADKPVSRIRRAIGQLTGLDL
jgi:hypothetical protein